MIISQGRTITKRPTVDAKLDKNPDDVGYATLEWVDWFNHRRLLEPNGYIPPTELEEMFYREVVS